MIMIGRRVSVVEKSAPMGRVTRELSILVDECEDPVRIRKNELVEWHDYEPFNPVVDGVPQQAQVFMMVPRLGRLVLLPCNAVTFGGEMTVIDRVICYFKSLRTKLGF